MERGAGGRGPGGGIHQTVHNPDFRVAGLGRAWPSVQRTPGEAGSSVRMRTVLHAHHFLLYTEHAIFVQAIRKPRALRRKPHQRISVEDSDKQS